MTCATILEVVVNGFVGFFTALFGAAFGAYAAYRYTVKNQKDTEQAAQYRAGASAMYVLLSRTRALENFCRNYLNEERTAIRPEQLTDLIFQYTPDTKVDFPSLSFLADPDDSQFLHDLSLSESHFFNFIDALSVRNFHLSEFTKSSTLHEFDPDTGEVVVSGDPRVLKLIANLNKDLGRGAGVAFRSTDNHVMHFAKLLNCRFPLSPKFTPSTIVKSPE